MHQMHHHSVPAVPSSLDILSTPTRWSCAVDGTKTHINVNRNALYWVSLPSTAAETAIAQCTSRCAMTRGHRLNISSVLAAVSLVFFGRYPRSSLHSLALFSPVPVPNKQPRFCGRKAKWSWSCLLGQNTTYPFWLTGRLKIHELTFTPLSSRQPLVCCPWLCASRHAGFGDHMPLVPGFQDHVREYSEMPVAVFSGACSYIKIRKYYYATSISAYWDSPSTLLLQLKASRSNVIPVIVCCCISVAVRKVCPEVTLCG